MMLACSCRIKADITKIKQKAIAWVGHIQRGESEVFKLLQFPFSSKYTVGRPVQTYLKAINSYLTTCKIDLTAKEIHRMCQDREGWLNNNK